MCVLCCDASVKCVLDKCVGSRSVQLRLSAILGSRCVVLSSTMHRSRCCVSKVCQVLDACEVERFLGFWFVTGFRCLHCVLGSR